MKNLSLLSGSKGILNHWLSCEEEQDTFDEFMTEVQTNIKIIAHEMDEDIEASRDY